MENPGLSGGQFYTDEGVTGIRNSFNAWLANVGSDAGLSFSVDPRSAQQTMSNFFGAFEMKAAQLRATNPTAIVPGTPSTPTFESGNSPITVNEPQSITQDATGPGAINRSSPYASYSSSSATADADRYSASLLPGVPVSEVKEQEAVDSVLKTVAWLTAVGLIFML